MDQAQRSVPSDSPAPSPHSRRPTWTVVWTKKSSAASPQSQSATPTLPKDELLNKNVVTRTDKIEDMFEDKIEDRAADIFAAMAEDQDEHQARDYSVALTISVIIAVENVFISSLTPMLLRRR